MFERHELIELREKAQHYAAIKNLNPDWQRAYLGLADAADRIDAMIARTEDYEKKT